MFELIVVKLLVEFCFSDGGVKAEVRVLGVIGQGVVTLLRLF